MAIPPAVKGDLVANAKTLPESGRPVRSAVDEACALCGCSRQACYKVLKSMGLVAPRKRRADAGRSKVRPEDVLAVTGMQQRTQRKSQHKRELPMTVAHDHLMREGAITPASTSTYYRQAKRMHLDRPARRAPEPCVVLRSEYSNQVWQIDASQPAQWYLKGGSFKYDPKLDMTQYKPETYKNGQLKRYIVADHFSGAFWVYYACAKGERAEDFLRCLWEAMAYKGDDYPMGGIPEMLYSDAGSGLTAAVTQGVFGALAIRYDHHKPGNPRAKGLIEGMHGHWEARFENKLLALGITQFSLDDLNQMAFEEARRWNAEFTHRRLKRTRFSAYTDGLNHDTLRYPPDWETMLRMAAPQSIDRVVGRDWYIRMDNHYYGVRALKHLPEAQPGSRLAFSPHPERPHELLVKGSDGLPYVLIPEALGPDMRPLSAPVLGREFKGAPDGLADTARKLALEAEIPADRARVTLLPAAVAKREKQAERIDRLTWVERYAAEWDVALHQAAQVYARRYADASTAPEAECGVLEETDIPIEPKTAHVGDRPWDAD